MKTEKVFSPNFQKEEKDMKKLVIVLMAVGLFGAMPVFAAEHGKHEMKQEMNSEERATECAQEVVSIQKKVEHIQSEIKKGSQKYSPEELKKLQDQLKEANKILDDMYKP